MRWMVLSLSLLALPASVAAQVDSADARFEAGRALRRDHRDAEALAHFQRLYEDSHQPRALAQVGLAEAALGRWAEAERHLAQALATPDTWITENRATGASLDQQSQRIATHLGSLEVACEVPGAEVWVGDRQVGAPGHAIRLEVGRVTFEVRAPGYAPTQRSAEVLAGGMSRETVALTRAPAVRQGGAPIATAQNTATLPVVATPAAGGSGVTRTLAWVTAGGAAVFLVGGAVAYAVGAPAAARWNDDQQCLRPGLTREQVCSSDGSTASTMSALELTGFIGGGVLAAASAALFYASRPSARGPSAWLACGAGPGALGVSCGGRF